MKDTNPRITLYKEAMALEEKRASLHSQIEEVLRKLADINGKLFDTVASSSATPSTSPVLAAPRSVTPRASLTGKRARRGELKTQLLRALAAAGSTGISVKEITATTGAKATSVHSWLQAARKQYPIKRLSQGLYRLDGGVPVETSAAAEAPAAKKSGRGPGRPSKRSTRPLSKRGELMSKIMSELQAAGSAGVKIPDLADKFGVKRKNLFIWFATTGRRNPAIKKMGESHYRLEGSAA